MFRDSGSGLKSFVVINLVLFLLRLLLGVMTVPESVAPALSILATVIFLGLPIYAIFLSAVSNWEKKSSLAILCVGVALHVMGFLLLRFVLPQTGFGTVVVQSLVQVGIAYWTLGLGSLVASSVKDKNLILPMALFLAGLDIFLVFNPDAPTSRIVRQNPVLFQSMAVKIPAARPDSTKKQGAQIVNQAFVGPADLLFMSTFLIALAKFKMRVKETFKWLIPVMVVYLILVLLPIGLSLLPALVPIGLCVLAVNRKEFQLSSEERLMVIFAGALSLGLAGFGLFRHFSDRKIAEPTVTSSPDPSQEFQGQITMPPPK